MTYFGDTFSTIFSLFLLIILGYGVKRAGLFTSDHAQILNNFIIYLALPALIFKAMQASTFQVNELGLAAFFAIVILLTAAGAFLIGTVVGLKREILGVFIIGSCLGNTGYLGYPLSISLFGEDMLVKAIYLDIFGTVLILFTLGLLLAERFGKSDQKFRKLREFALFPPAIAFLIGILAQGVEIPAVLQVSIDHLALAAISMIMVSIGLNLRFSALRGGGTALVAGVLLKLAVMPLIVLGAISLLPLDTQNAKIILLQASMPTAMMTQVIAIRYNMDDSLLPLLILFTTLLSLFTVPLWQAIAI